LRSGLDRENHSIGVGLQNHPTVSFVLGRRTDDMGIFDAAVVKNFTVGNRDALLIAYERLDGQSTENAMLSSAIMNPSSRGRVSLRDDEAVVQFNMLSEPDDVIAMREAVRHMIRTVTQPHFEAVVTQVMVDSQGSSVTTLVDMEDTDLDEWIKAHLSLVSHATSSCAGAIDSRSGALLGMANITIADASVLNSVPACTPAAPVAYEARRIAELLGEHLA
jgi:choline dehydrogenase-like flavoprotein